MKHIFQSLFVASAVILMVLFNGCNPNLPENQPEIGTHEAVDLGLSVRWATCNVGAEVPEASGDYFAWGEVAPKDDFNLESYKSECNKTVMTFEYDAAFINWGGKWRTPTRTEMRELRTKCTWKWTSLNGVYGYKVVGKNGNSIFLPAAGCVVEVDKSGLDKAGHYWTTAGFTMKDHYGRSLFFGEYLVDEYNAYSWYGYSVRPVCQ